MSTDLQLISTDEDVDEAHGSQGCFPVGPECIKKVPKKYHIKWRQEK